MVHKNVEIKCKNVKKKKLHFEYMQNVHFKRVFTNCVFVHFYLK